MSNLDVALEYLEFGLPVIPCNASKVATIKWEEYQKRMPTEEEVSGWWATNNIPAMAMITGSLSNIVVIDLDDMVVGKQNLEKFFNLDIPTVKVKTPSGGLHFYFKHPGFEVRSWVGENANIEGVDFRGDGGYVIIPPAFCDYQKRGKRIAGYYEWLTSILNNDVLELPILFLDFLNNIYRGVDKGKNNVSTSDYNVHNCLQEGRRDATIFHLANCLVKGRCENSLSEYALDIIAKKCEPPFPENELQAKIKSALNRARKRETNLSADVEEWIVSTTGDFLSTDIDKCLQLTTREEKKNLSIILKRLSEKKEKPPIKKVPGRNGHWCKIDDEVEYINWQDASDEEYPVNFPLNLNELVKLYPSNIAVVAGASNAGKTSFLLETIRLNQKKYKITYLNSEMAGPELKLRIRLFEDVIKPADWKFTAIERSSNFSDIIDPDGFNIIDFMEVYEDFWKIGGWIRDVHLRLKKGIAIIAIQKKGSTKKDTQNYGRGGELTLEKPRLYLAMDYGKIKIVKAKIWRNHDRNPNGLVREFNLINGWKFMPKDEWSYEDERKKAKDYEGFPHED